MMGPGFANEFEKRMITALIILILTAFLLGIAVTKGCEYLVKHFRISVELAD